MRLRYIPVAMLVLPLYAIFVFAAKGQQFSVLGSFNGMKGAQPQGTLIQGSDGNFYGTTYKGAQAITGPSSR